MGKFLKETEKIKKSKTKKLIDQRLSEFKAKNKKSNKEWFSELCFCLLTANWKAKEAIAIQEELDRTDFCSCNEKKLKAFLKEKGHRFWPQRAEMIVLASKNKNIKDILSNEKEPREWLVKNIKGLGYKEASHFLRNVGYEDYTIIDFHIIDVLVRNKIIKKPKTLTKKRYLEIEKTLKKIADKLNMTLAELDLYLWCMETGQVLK